MVAYADTVTVGASLTACPLAGKLSLDSLLFDFFSTLLLLLVANDVLNELLKERLKLDFILP